MLDKTFFIGTMLLIVWIVWSIATNSIGTTECMLLLVGVVLGILAGSNRSKRTRENRNGQEEPLCGCNTYRVCCSESYIKYYDSFVFSNKSGRTLAIDYFCRWRSFPRACFILPSTEID